MIPVILASNFDGIELIFLVSFAALAFFLGTIFSIARKKTAGFIFGALCGLAGLMAILFALNYLGERQRESFICGFIALALGTLLVLGNWRPDSL